MSSLVATILLVVFVILVVVVISRSVRIVPQARAGIVERFGRYHRTLHAGLNMVTPFVDRLLPLLDLREQVVSFPPQPVITQDNLVVSIDTVIYFQVTDARAATYEVANFITAVEQLTVTTLRNVVGGMDLETALTSRDQINSELRKELDEATGKWGIRVGRVELKAIEPPGSIQDSMEKQMRADRDKRAAILSAEGSKQSAILTAEGERQAAVLKARGDSEALVLRAEADAKAQAARARGQAEAISTVFRPSTRATRTSACSPTSTCRCCRRSPRATRTRSGSCRARSARPWRASAVSSAPPPRAGPTPRPSRPRQCPPRQYPLRQGRGRSSTRPPAVTRVSKDGWRAVAGPCTTVPSAITKVDPCQGQAMQAAPRSTTIRP